MKARVELTNGPLDGLKIDRPPTGVAVIPWGFKREGDALLTCVAHEGKACGRATYKQGLIAESDKLFYVWP